MEGSEPAAVEFRMRASDGTYRWMESHYTPLRDAGGQLLEIEGILTDITEKKEAAEKIMALARTDAMTGLANRATFIDRLCQERFGPATRRRFAWAMAIFPSGGGESNAQRFLMPNMYTFCSPMQVLSKWRRSRNCGVLESWPILARAWIKRM